MKNKRKIQKNSGSAMMIVIIFFMFISLAIIAGLISPTVRAFQDSSVNLKSKSSYYLAESGSEDAYYRLITGRPISSSETITLDSNSVTTTITSGANQKEIVSLGDASSFQRKVDLVIKTGAGVAFNYGLQSGNGGVKMDGGSTIKGNIYSNGPIDAISASITGTAVAADSFAYTADQSNGTATTPPSTINFGDAAASQDFAQSFQVSTAAPINKIQLYLKKTSSSPSDATIKIVTNNGGSPSTTVVDSTTLSAGNVSSSNFAWIDAVFPNSPSLTPNTTYWVVVDNSSNNASKYYIIGATPDSSYSLGTAKTGASGGTWTTKNLDGYFNVFTGGIQSYIGRATYDGGLTVGGDAWATTVKGTNVAGHLYCVTGTYTSGKPCDTSHGSPSPLPLPFSDANIQDWKDDGTAGGIITGATSCPGGYSNGDCNVNWKNATFGPGKITGNLTVNGGGTLTLTGTVYVVGKLLVTGGGKIMLPSYYALNSGTIISDGQMAIEGGGNLGSGTAGSYLFLVSTSQCPSGAGCSWGEAVGSSAITVTGGAGAIAVDAQYGNVSLSGGAALNAAVGNSITATGGDTVTYDQGLASPSFSSGPSGSWVVNTWKEAQ